MKSKTNLKSFQRKQKAKIKKKVMEITINMILRRTRISRKTIKILEINNSNSFNKYRITFNKPQHVSNLSHHFCKYREPIKFLSELKD